MNGSTVQKRPLKYAGNKTGNPTATLDDGTEVPIGATVWVPLVEARTLLNDPDLPSAAIEDLDWVPGRREDIV